MTKAALAIGIFVLFGAIAGFIAAPLIDAALTQTYHTTLLTVSELDSGWEGGTADLYLQVKPGTGRVFIDSFPLSKLDTQFSARYAHEMACAFLQNSCGTNDFFYTIRADSSVVGGPSAGAAITILTIAALDRQPIRQDVAITGTINSGGLIGPVAGIIPKVEAGRKAGMTVVLVPALTSLGLEEARIDKGSDPNATINYSQAYDDTVLASLSGDGFTVVQVTDLNEALPYFIGKSYPQETTDLVVPESYSEIMRQVSSTLCSRRQALLAQVGDVVEGNETLHNRSVEIDESVRKADEAGDYYSKASYCFSHSIELRGILLRDNDQRGLQELLRENRRQLLVLEASLDQEPLETIGDLETYAIVRERVIEARKTLDELNKSDINRDDLAYAMERTYSAEIWATFFDMQSTPYVINDGYLRRACANKLAEADERVSYVEEYLPKTLTEPGRDELELARRDHREEEFALCLFKASKAKAEASILSSALAISEPRLDQLVERKLVAVEHVLSHQSRRGLFPIMGYSYYEYARSLQEEQPYSALTFAEYALELSNIDMYFPEREPWWHGLEQTFDAKVLLVFLIGAITGGLALYAMLRR